MSARFQLERFDGKGDFGLWRKKMRALLVLQKVEKALDDPSKFPETLSQDEIQEMTEIAYSTIILHLSDSVLRRVSDIDNVAELWTKLEKLYMSKSHTNIIYLKERLFSYKMDSSKSLEDNIDEFNAICMDLADAGENLSEENQAVIFLNSLPERYKEVKAAIKYGRDTLTLDFVLDWLRSRELELENEQKDTEALFKKGNKYKGKAFQRTNSDGKDQKVTCHYCHKEGHFKWNCPQLKKKGKLPERGENRHSTDFLDEYEYAEVLMVTNQYAEEEEWIMDSGCTFHMTPHKLYFSDLNEVEGGKVIMGNNKQCEIKGTGSIRLQLNDGSIWILSSVRYVPGLKRNLISLGTLDKSGYSYRSENGSLIVYKDSSVKLRGVLKHGLYVLQGSTLVGELNNGTESNLSETYLWHKRCWGTSAQED